tara:strand:- start:1334 stop:1525 length:192 start_codon:yes stop_codon:yes gene_type:complete
MSFASDQPQWLQAQNPLESQADFPHAGQSMSQKLTYGYGEMTDPALRGIHSLRSLGGFPQSLR